eukprot:Unigene10406_Nuclearia_a/m.31793 Unigene10406_Nuclearia_a/g.31793  ORF Unigene10406_Nuclearia_a/g.31793 Unigene10406_Nuclearia_a/m.31793 type:complete len:549 (+) Unigene10406_Nuclearia_a:639-2285(+)
MMLLENRLEVCVEAVTASSITFSLGVVPQQDVNNHVKLMDQARPPSTLWSFLVTPLSASRLASALGNLLVPEASRKTPASVGAEAPLGAGIPGTMNSLDELLPHPATWDTSDKNLLVILDGCAVRGEQLRRVHSDDEVPTLTIADLAPATTHSVRVFVRFFALECIVASPFVSFATLSDARSDLAAAAAAASAASARPTASAAAAPAVRPAPPSAPSGGDAAEHDVGEGSSATGPATGDGHGAEPAMSAAARDDLVAQATAAGALDSLASMSEAELQRLLDIELVIRKEQQATIKRLKRDFQKQESALKAELVSLQNAMLKDETKEKREQRRMDSLRQSLRQQEVVVQQLEQDAQRIRAERKQLTDRIAAAQGAIAATTEQLRAAERNVVKLAAQHTKAMAELEKENARMVREAHETRTALDKVSQALETSLETLHSMTSEIDVLKEQQRLVQLDAEHLLGREVAMVREAETRAASVEQAIGSLTQHNQRVPGRRARLRFLRALLTFALCSCARPCATRPNSSSSCWTSSRASRECTLQYCSGGAWTD